MSSVAPFGCRAFRALKPDRDRFVLPLSQPDWATKSFSLFQSPQLGYWALSFKPVRDWFVLWSLSSQVGRLILSVKFSQLSCWVFPCIRPVRDWSVGSPSAFKLDDKIFFFFSSHLVLVAELQCFQARSRLVCLPSLSNQTGWLVCLSLVLPTGGAHSNLRVVSSGARTQVLFAMWTVLLQRHYNSDFHQE